MELLGQVVFLDLGGSCGSRNYTEKYLINLKTKLFLLLIFILIFRTGIFLFC